MCIYIIEYIYPLVNLISCKATQLTNCGIPPGSADDPNGFSMVCGGIAACILWAVFVDSKALQERPKGEIIRNLTPNSIFANSFAFRMRVSNPKEPTQRSTVALEGNLNDQSPAENRFHFSSMIITMAESFHDLGLRSHIDWNIWYQGYGGMGWALFVTKNVGYFLVSSKMANTL